MANIQIPTSVTIINSGLIGYMGISLTNFTTSAVSAIAEGSSIEIAGAFFKFSSDETINASSWTAITTATTAYLALTPSGTAGSQILTAAWASSAPVWSTSKQGWYASAGSNVRIVAQAYKNSITSQERKYLLGLNAGQLESYRFRGEKEVLTATSGSYIVPAGVYKLRVICVGGGGGGGGAAALSGGGGGGGGGTIVSPFSAQIVHVVPGQSIAYTVGAGGVAGSTSGGNGGDGGQSTFGTVTGLGGGGGPGYTSAGVPGGIGASGNSGASGCGTCIGVSSGNYAGGTGGGCGGKGGNQSDGTNANGYGGGGGGGSASGGTGKAGGVGGSGIIIVEY